MLQDISRFWQLVGSKRNDDRNQADQPVVPPSEPGPAKAAAILVSLE
jgi:hypothetical protein